MRVRALLKAANGFGYLSLSFFLIIIGTTVLAPAPFSDETELPHKTQADSSAEAEIASSLKRSAIRTDSRNNLE